MVYYRFHSKNDVKETLLKKITFFFVIAIWLSWVLLEVPWSIVLATTAPSTIVAKGSLSVSVPQSVSDEITEEISFVEPAIGVLTSPYGQRWGKTHEGIDIGGEIGTDILAADSGTVLLSRWVDGYGNYIELEHKNGYKTIYGHCDSLLVDEGDIVSRGQKIATMGNTGNSTGPHLHFEVILNGEPQNPLDYVIY